MQAEAFLEPGRSYADQRIDNTKVKTLLIFTLWQKQRELNVDEGNRA